MRFTHRPLTLTGVLIGLMCGACAPPAAPVNPSPRIKLSAAVALGQTTLEGTVMMFSVDYRFVEGAPSQEATYAWVIQPSQGEPLEQIMKLRRQDTLQAMVPQWRPEQGPFTCRIEQVAADGSREALTDSVTMR